MGHPETWAKLCLEKAGIDLSIFSPHSERSASTSMAYGIVPLKTVLKAGGVEVPLLLFTANRF